MLSLSLSPLIFLLTDHLSLSLSLSLLSSLILSQKIPTQITSSLGPFFTGRSTNQAPQPRSFLHHPIHEPSSGDPDPIFISQSTNQSPRPRSFLHWPIHEPSSTTQITSSPPDPRTSSTSTDLSLCWFVCVGLFVCGCVSVLICPCGCVCF